MPGIALTDTRHINLKNAKVLAMGISESKAQYPSMPNVSTELSNIMKLWPGKAILNKEFTLDNLQKQYQKGDFSIIHLATDVQISNKINDSSMLFWDRLVKLDEIKKLNFYNPSLELLVLSNFSRFLDNKELEFGFASVAFQSGARSVLTSSFHVDDEGTMFLITDFYNQLRTAPTKSEALRRSQLEMLKREKFQHPFYWAGFTIIGNPW